MLRAALCSATIVATMGLTASPAAAVSVYQEASGAPCPAVTVSGHTVSGGCLLSLQSEPSEQVEVTGPFGIMYLCVWTTSLRENANGEGYFFNQVLFGDDCGLSPCTESNGQRKPWPAELTSELWMEWVFCIQGAFGIVNCHLNNVEVIPPDHSFSAEMRTRGTSHDYCEIGVTRVQGHWNISRPVPVEVVD